MTSIQNPEQPNLNKPVRAVLDLGSQRSYITQKAATSLQLRSKGMQQMSIMTFGSAATQTKCELVHVLMKTLCGEMELRLLTTPIICEPLNTRPITLGTNSYEHISDLILADEFDRDGITEVDMLLGADYYWELAMHWSSETWRQWPSCCGDKVRMGTIWSCGNRYHCFVQPSRYSQSQSYIDGKLSRVELRLGQNSAFILGTRIPRCCESDSICSARI